MRTVAASRRGVLGAGLIAIAAFVSSPARAQNLEELLSRGQVVLVEQDAKGKFKQATAIIEVAKPPDEVWKLVANAAGWKDFIPKIVKSDPTPVKDKENQVDVALEIEVPGANTEYTFRYEIDATAKTMKGHWVAGDLKGSTCIWKVTPFGSGSLVSYTSASKNFSSLAESFEDDQQTMTVGVNVGAALAAAKAVKERAENGKTAAAEVR